MLVGENVLKYITERFSQGEIYNIRTYGIKQILSIFELFNNGHITHFIEILIVRFEKKFDKNE